MAITQEVTNLTQIEYQRYGYMALTLTNFGNGLLPAIAAGSKVEIGGSLFYCAPEQAITAWGGIASSTIAYIKIIPQGDGPPETALAEFTDTAPVWSDTKQGYYVGTSRYVATLYKDGSDNYSNKKIIELTPSNDAGLIAPFIMKQQVGWLWCNGDQINKTTNPEYTNLVGLLKQEAGAGPHPYYHADANIAVLPNLKGAVVRGVDTAANRDKDGVRKSGNYQADDNKTHAHNHRHAYTIATTQQAPSSYAYRSSAIDPANLYTAYDATASGDPDEATVKNVALYYLIKY